MQEKKLLPNINDFLEQENNKKNPPTADGLGELVALVRARTGLSRQVAFMVVSEFFNQIRKYMLNGDIVSLTELGNFLISSPINNGNKFRVFAKFQMSKLLNRKLNANRRSG